MLPYGLASWWAWRRRYCLERWTFLEMGDTGWQRKGARQGRLGQHAQERCCLLQIHQCLLAARTALHVRSVFRLFLG